MPRLLTLFQSQFRVERCVAELELNGFTPLEVRLYQFSAPPRQRHGLLRWLAKGGIFGDSIDQSDGVSTMDGMTVGAAIGAVWGVVAGSRMPWGPVVVGLFGLLAGGLISLLVDLLIPERRRGLYETKRLHGLLLLDIATVDEHRFELAREIARRNEPVQSALIGDEPPGAETNTKRPG